MFVFLCARAKLHQQERALKLCSATLNHCINTNSVNYKHYALYQFYKPHNYKEQKLHFLAWFRGCKCPNWFSKNCIKLCWPCGTRGAFHNFKFHASLRVSVRFLCATPFWFSFFCRKKTFLRVLPSHVDSCVFLFGARPLTQILQLWKFSWQF